jgi:hypothetical protein
MMLKEPLALFSGTTGISKNAWKGAMDLDATFVVVVVVVVVVKKRMLGCAL